MTYFAGIDVSLEEAHVCVVNEMGAVIAEGKVASEPAALGAWLLAQGRRLERVGLEAGPLSQWLHAGLEAAGLAVVLLETRHLKAALGAMTVKTDRKDARGIAQAVRTGWYRAVHVKSLEAQEVRALLMARKQLVDRCNNVEGSIRGLLRNFGLKLGKVGKARFEARVRELLGDGGGLAVAIEPMLRARAVLMAEGAVLHRAVLQTARQDPVCRLLMTATGVGAIVSLTYRSGVDDPRRFARSSAVGAHFGLTQGRYQSGQVDRTGRITKVGDEMVRTALYQAAHTILTRHVRWSSLKAWAMAVAKRRGMKRAKVALARRLAVILHRMWVDGTEFRWGREENAATQRAA